MYDTKLECQDWRYSAAILGMVRFFEYWKETEEVPAEYSENTDHIEFDQAYITRERFLLFAEHFFKDGMYHVRVEEILRSHSSISEEQIKLINNDLKGNIVMKKIFSKTRFSGTNNEDILNLISENRYQLIEETFRYKQNMYSDYCNKILLGKEEQPYCRLLGYHIDKGRKNQSYSYGFDKRKGLFSDCRYFDFIPFAFTNTDEAIFINNNFNIRTLMKANDYLEDRIQTFRNDQQDKNKSVNARELLYQAIIDSTDFLHNDIEIITKKRDLEHFETLYIRGDKITILKDIKEIRPFMFSYKINGNYFINVLQAVMDSIVNGLNMNPLIDLFLKADMDRDKTGNYSYVISRLIEINLRIKGDHEMNEHAKWAYMSAKEVTKVLRGRKQENKIISYKQKLITAMTARDFERVCDILLQLSTYADVEFNFAYDLFDDFEKNENIAYTFINALGTRTEQEKQVR